MSNEFYDDLSTSLNQALAIAKGEAEPSRKFSYEMPDIKLIRTKTGYRSSNSPISLILARVRYRIGNKVLETQQGQRLRSCAC